MAEWLKAHAWKACVRETVPWVRIPLSPPTWPKPYILCVGLWAIKSTAAAISLSNSGLLLGRTRSLFSKCPFISEALDSADSVRFSKVECLERLMNFN